MSDPEIMNGILVKCTANAGVVVVPEGVTEIGSFAFRGRCSLTSITLPKGVTEIGDWAFAGCSGLTSIALPKGVTEIGSYAFGGCSGLTSIALPKGVTEIGEHAFGGCSGLTSIALPEEVTEIGKSAFLDCRGITSITLPEGLKKIGAYAFKGCSGLTSMTLPEGLTEIGERVFQSCSGLTSMTLPEGLTKIGMGAFSGCRGLTSITLPEGLTKIGEEAFAGCSSLMSITLPEGVTTIRSYTFNGCSSLTSITLPEGLTTIGESAFRDCNSLTSITLPEGLTTIGESAFRDCSGLTSITLPSSVTRIGKDAFEGCALLPGRGKETLCIAISGALRTEDGYLISTGSYPIGEDGTRYILRDDVVYTEDMRRVVGAGRSCESLRLADGIVEIGEAAFQHCFVDELTLPEGLHTIGAHAFKDCRQLRCIVLPSTVRRIERGAFTGCVCLILSSEEAAAFVSVDFDTDVWWDTYGSGARESIIPFSYICAVTLRENEREAELYARDSVIAITLPEQVIAVDTEELIAAVYECGIEHICVQNEALLIQLLRTVPELRELLLRVNMERILNSPEALAVPELQQAPYFDRLMDYARAHDMMPAVAMLLEAHHAAAADPDEDDLDLDLSSDEETEQRFVIRNGVLLRCPDREAEIVTVPAGVTEIADGAFPDHPGCILFPETVSRIARAPIRGSFDADSRCSTLLLDARTAYRSWGSGAGQRGSGYASHYWSDYSTPGVWMDWGDGDPGYSVPDPLEASVYGIEPEWEGEPNETEAELLPICAAQLRERDRVRDVELWLTMKYNVYRAGEVCLTQLTLPPQLIRLDVPALQAGLKSVRVERFTVYGEEALEQLLREAPEYRLRLAEDNAERILTSPRLIELPMLTEGPLFVRLTQYADSHGMKDAADRLRLLRRERAAGTAGKRPQASAGQDRAGAMAP